MYLLDTNVLSELRKAGDGKADVTVAAWISGNRVGDFFLSVITVMELEIDILRLERRDPAQASKLRQWLNRNVLPEFKSRTLGIDTAVARRCARLHVPDPRPERDALIAGTALVHGMTVVTRNVSDFAATGVSVLNPWVAS